MNFNTPIPRTTAPKWHEGSPLRSVRDSDANATAWKRSQNSGSQSEDYGRALTKLQKELNKLKRRQTGYDNRQLENFFPFKIYQPTGTSNTFQIRDGIVEYRSAYFVSVVTGNAGNFSNALYCPNTDYNSNAIYSINPSSLANGVNFDRVQVNNGNPIAVTNVATLISESVESQQANQITTVALATGTGVIFWIQIVDDPTLGVYVQTYAQVVNFTTTNFPVYPQGANIVPIGFVVWNGSSYDIQQYQYGNLVQPYRNLGPIYNATLPSGFWDYPQILRGNWSEIINNVGSGSFGLFYPGDIVQDNTSFHAIGGFNFQTSYICINPTPFITSTPPNIDFNNNAGDWIPVTSVIVNP